VGDAKLEIAQYQQEVGDARQECLQLDEQLTSKKHEYTLLEEQFENLMTSEENLLDKLNDQEIIIKQLQCDVTDARNGADELERQINVIKKENQSSDQEKDLKTRELEEIIEASRDTERQMRQHISRLDQSEAVVRIRLEGVESADEYRGKLELDLRERIEELRMSSDEQRNTVNALRGMLEESREKMSGLDEENARLRESLELSRALTAEYQHDIVGSMTGQNAIDDRPTVDGRSDYDTLRRYDALPLSAVILR